MHQVSPADYPAKVATDQWRPCATPGELTAVNQTERILTLLQILPVGMGTSSSTGPVLAARLGISERTLYRDIALLNEYEQVRSDHDGYYLATAGPRTTGNLSAREIMTLLYVAQWAGVVLPAGMLSDHDEAVRKLAALHGSAEAFRVAQEGTDGLTIQPTTTDGKSAPRNVATAILARQRRRKLRGRYYTPGSDTESLRILHPYAVIYRSRAHYLTAFCETRGKERTFRLDRFRTLEMLDETADIPANYNPSAAFTNAWEVVGGRKSRVVIRLRGELARRMRDAQLHSSQKVLASSADLLDLQFSVAISQEFVGWILGLGPEALVLSPQTLAARIQTQAAAVAASYGAEGTGKDRD